MTIGTDQSPFERYRVRAASLTIWSKAGWMKSANWISAMGSMPFSAAPMATPTMADSALLSAERAARHLLRLTWTAAGQPARTLRVLLAAPQRGGSQGGSPVARRRPDGGQVPGGQDAQADVVLHRAHAAA